ncbi:hypothetical protein CEE60_19815 [Stenotrophomonas maltophilia]|uniref:Transmembrane protein n=1 Tax=Stenotrophomonas maltophilia TaxID=40324 RepID=A0A246HH12_STEMA|nr:MULTISPECIES: hypothetical protein [Stenotrophomonas]MBW8374604.1 hypothetical protein [Stenotrophomonas sp.]OWQ49366.1 hypothetical protein CEE60_19815 [Stenotrophomonas maltophilia]
MKSKKLISVFGGIAVVCALAFASSQALATSSQPKPLAGCAEQPNCTYGGHGVYLCCDPL